MGLTLQRLLDLALSAHLQALVLLRLRDPILNQTHNQLHNPAHSQAHNPILRLMINPEMKLMIRQIPNLARNLGLNQQALQRPLALTLL
jgi:hypothetical protein